MTAQQAKHVEIRAMREAYEVKMLKKVRRMKANRLRNQIRRHLDEDVQRLGVIVALERLENVARYYAYTLTRKEKVLRGRRCAVFCFRPVPLECGSAPMSFSYPFSKLKGR